MPAESDTGRVLYLSHPQVAIDPAVPVPDWPLSAVGRARVERFAAGPRLRRVTAVYSSAERKAVDTGAILAERLGVPLTTVEAMHENDRTATGFLPPERFEAVADRFFAEPGASVLGWERAVDAQARIVASIREILERDTTGGDILLAGHGGVGALLLAHLLGEPISRRLDQPATGGGNLFAFRRADLGVIHGWRTMENVDRRETVVGGRSQPT
ncbi:MAG: histidine phosphatase family protein [Geminicoccaceae bacterium]